MDRVVYLYVSHFDKLHVTNPLAVRLSPVEALLKSF